MSAASSTSEMSYDARAIFFDNAYHPGEGDEIAVTSPVTEAVVARFRAATPEQVNRAVRVARAAFDSGVWSDPGFRKTVLLKFADLLEQNRDALMDVLLSEIGSPVSLKANHIDTPAAFVRWFADHGTRDTTRQLGLNTAKTGVSMVAYRPVGVVAAITAFNYPLLIGVSKIGAALATGCTTVLLSSPQAPLSVMMLGDLIKLAGFPPGVVNLLSGAAETGRALTEHPEVDKVSFTGSVNVGREVLRQSAGGLKGCVLELGGKSAAIMLPGTDFNKYAFQLHARYARNAGQGCGSPTRILVEEARLEEFIEASRKIWPRILVGDPSDPATIVGPLVSGAQRDRVEAGIARAVENGARILAGGGRPDIAKGWFMNPVLVGGLNNTAEIARQELFGPVSVVLTYRTVDEAIAIANDSELGLKAYVFGKLDECLAIVPRLRVGTVQINGGSPLRPDAPMNGYKNSGLGVEWGIDGLREFLLPQHIDCALG